MSTSRAGNENTETPGWMEPLPNLTFWTVMSLPHVTPPSNVS
mgnify:CR=1 FL=1